VSLHGEVPDPQSPPPGCPFAPRCDLVLDACTVEPIPPLVIRGGSGRAACIRLEEAARLRSSLRVDELWSPVSASADAAVELRGVEKAFALREGLRRSSSVQALRGVDLDVAQGESVALVGESGSGKSTLLRIVAGLEAADGGDVFVAAEAPQMVFQDALSSLTPWLSVRELVGERLARHGIGRAAVDARVREALQRVGLPEKVALARPRQLSGGQAQRVAIARAIVEPPGLLLADEPTSSLDVSLRAVILNLLNRLRRELDLAVLFVTHDLAAARIVADRVAVMHDGRIVEVGPAEQVCTSPHDAYTRKLLESLPGQSMDVIDGVEGAH